jgi:hypothetical protein
MKSDDEVNEEAKSDSQRKFFNAVHKCKAEGDCGSEAIKKAADGMSMDDVEDFAYTRGKLPDSVDEENLEESIRPRMTKSELIETILGNTKKKRVIKTLKIKDLRK